MERKIGEIFEYEGKRLKVVQHKGCSPMCVIGKTKKCISSFDLVAGNCTPARKDGKEVIFVEVSQ